MQSTTDPVTKKTHIQTKKENLARFKTEKQIPPRCYLTHAYRNLLLCPHLQLFIYTSGGSLEMIVVQQNNYLKHC